MTAADREAALAQRIRHLRLAAGIAQTTAATGAHVARSTWQRWETGEVTPSAIRIPDIARALNTPIAALYCGDGDVALADIILTHTAIDRIRNNGEPELNALTQRITEQLRPRLTNAATLAATTDGGRLKARPRRVHDRSAILRDLDRRKANRRRSGTPPAMVSV